MDDYIKRSDALAWNPDSKDDRKYDTLNLDDAYELGYEDKLKQIEKIPATDVVKVVRCRDCKRWWVDKISGLGVMFGYCENVRPRKLTTGSWFCADGERRTEDG